MSPLAAVGPSVYWYLTRGSGVVALVLLTVSVVIGIAGTMRLSAVTWPRFAVETVHRDVSLLVIVFLLIHIATSVLDSFAPISITASVIPFISSYRPIWLGLGTVGFDLIVALAVTSLVRRRLGYGTWRAIHWLAYVSWPVAVLHGLGTGSDVKAKWLLAITVLCVLAVFGAAALRFARGEGTPAGVRVPAVVLSLAVPLGMAAFALAGPLQKGWAKKAGTPAKLLAHAAPVVPVSTGVGGTGSSGGGGSSSGGRAPGPFDAQLTGHVTQHQAAGGGVVDLDLHLVGPLQGRLRVRLAGSPMPGGGLSMTGSQVDLLLGDRVGSVLAGTISELQGSDFVAHVTGAGARMTLSVRLDIDQQTGNVSGSVRATT